MFEFLKNTRIIARV